jgi:hypothetical protein
MGFFSQKNASLFLTTTRSETTFGSKVASERQKKVNTEQPPRAAGQPKPCSPLHSRRRGVPLCPRLVDSEGSSPVWHVRPTRPRTTCLCKGQNAGRMCALDVCLPLGVPSSFPLALHACSLAVRCADPNTGPRAIGTSPLCISAPCDAPCGKCSQRTYDAVVQWFASVVLSK